MLFERSLLLQSLLTQMKILCMRCVLRLAFFILLVSAFANSALAQSGASQ